MEELVHKLRCSLVLITISTRRQLARYNKVTSQIDPDTFERHIEDIMLAIWRCNNTIDSAFRDLEGVAYNEANEELIYGLHQTKEEILGIFVATGMIHAAIMDEREAAVKEARAESMQLALSNALTQMDEVRAAHDALAASLAAAEAEDETDYDDDYDEEVEEDEGEGDGEL